MWTPDETIDYSGDFPDHDPTGYSRMGEMKFMETKFREARQYILANPAAFVSRFFGRMVEFWYFPYPIEWIVLSVLGWAGASLVWKTHQNSWLFIVPLFTYPLVFCVTHLFANYRHPIDPIIILLAAYAIVDVGRRYHEHVKSNVETEPCLNGRSAPVLRQNSCGDHIGGRQSPVQSQLYPSL
jgi:hypothetical protein